MGDPKRSRRKYQEPTHPWEGERIKSEDEYVRKYGLKNKKEFWKAESLLRAQRAQARQYLPLVMRDDPQGKKEADQLIGKLNRLGLLEQDASLGDVLALDVDSILSRRLQTVAFLKGLAATPKQARQFIAHGHIAIGGRRIDVPGYLVRRAEEDKIGYAPTSPLQNEAHPLRQAAGGDVASTSTAEEIAEDVEAELDIDEDEATDEADDADESSEEEEDADEAEEASEDEEDADEATEDEDAEEESSEDEVDEEEADQPEEEAEADEAEAEAEDEGASEDAEAEAQAEDEADETKDGEAA